jgi:SAM-dependent methyltransferase
MTTTIDSDVKKQVRQFYDRVGWQEIGAGVYQNARYEDLRPVSQEYIHRCHLRVGRQLNPSGEYFLDAGSGPIQYPEYLEYSKGYQARVCADISIVALQEARQRIGDRQSGGHGLFVVADIANLPFKPESFQGVISLHTLHHLPVEEHRQAYQELYRLLGSQTTGVVVVGWDNPGLMRFFNAPIRWYNRTKKSLLRQLGKSAGSPGMDQRAPQVVKGAKGTFVSKHDSTWLKSEIGALMPVEVLVWRSASVRFLRAFVHPWLAGRYVLRVLYALEERYPNFFGEHGQYPLIVIRKA